jgi:hypothetical protein
MSKSERGVGPNTGIGRYCLKADLAQTGDRNRKLARAIQKARIGTSQEFS